MSTKKILIDRKFTLFSLLIWLGFVVFYLIFKYPIVDFIYNQFLNKLNKPGLIFYLNKSDLYFKASNVIFFYIFIIFFVGKFLNYKLIKNQVFLTKILGLCLAFFCLYLILGLTLVQKNHGYVFFGSDYEWLLFRWDIWHKGSKPTILIWTSPFYLLKYLSVFIPLKNLAVLWNSFLGALGLFLSSFCFRKILKNDLDTLLYCSLLGLAMSHLFFSIFPESRTLQVCSLLPTYIVFLYSLENKKIYFKFWILAGILSFGVIMTNFATTLVCFLVTVFILKRKQLILKTLQFLGMVILLSVILSLIQKMLFPTAHYFFLRDSVGNDLMEQYVNVNILNNPLIVIREIIKNFLLINFVSPEPLIIPDVTSSSPIANYLSFFGDSLNYSLWGLLAVALWLILFFKGLINNVLKLPRERKIFLIGVFLCLLFYLTIHSFIGVKELFLYAPNLTFLMIFISIPLLTKLTVLDRRLLMSLIILMGINNLMVIKNIILSVSN